MPDKGNFFKDFCQISCLDGGLRSPNVASWYLYRLHDRHWWLVIPTDGWAYSVAFFATTFSIIMMPPAHRILSAQIPATYHARQTADTSRNECSSVGSAIQYGMQYGMLMACPAATMTAINTIVHHKHNADQVCFVYEKRYLKPHFGKKQDWSLWSYPRDTRCFIWPRNLCPKGFPKTKRFAQIPVLRSENAKPGFGFRFWVHDVTGTNVYWWRKVLTFNWTVC